MWMEAHFYIGKIGPMRFFCFTILAVSALSAQVSTSYAPYQFGPRERWRLTSHGDAGESRYEAGKLILDFTKGADWIGIAPPDTVLLGNVGAVKLHVEGASAKHPLHLFLRTHFMTFHQTVPVQEGAKEIAVKGPPGPGWQWMNGENDGRIHGPLRLGEIRFEGNGIKDRVELELTDVTVEGSQPADKLCVATAAGFVVQVRCMGGAALDGDVTWTVRDWDGKELAQGHEAVNVPPKAEIATVMMRAPSAGGRKFLEVEFRANLPGQTIAPAYGYWTMDQPRQTDSKLSPASPFGMGVYLDRYPAGQEMERAAVMARDAGVKWIREGFSWGRIEPQRGKFDWKFYDALVAVAKENGISIYGLVSGWAPWTKPYSEEGIADYQAFLKELVQHYREDVHHWEIWNEPNIFFWQGPKEMYAELLRRSYATIKAADPSAKVLGMSTSGIDYNFIAKTMALDAPFDILTIHPYRKTFNDRALINEMKIVSDLVKGRPVWVTEFGWTTLTPHNTISQDFAPVTERQQAELLARAYLSMMAADPHANISWYDFRNDGDDPLYFENEMGVLYHDYSPKPAYWVYSTMTRLLKDKPPAAAVDAGDPAVFAYRFGNVTALWSGDKDRVATIPLKGQGATLMNAIGESRELTGAEAKIELRVGAPVYVVAAN
jgi:hypothetical protein